MEDSLKAGILLSLIKQLFIEPFSTIFARCSKVRHFDVIPRNAETIELLRDFNNLSVLDISANPIADLSVVEGLTDLTELVSLYANEITDIQVLAGLTQLGSLSLAENGITDLSPLENLTDMTNLNLASNNITDNSSLASLTKLR